MENEKMDGYFNALSEKLQKRDFVARSFTDIADFPLAVGQGLYILDLIKKEVSFQKGIKQFLGYKPEEFTFSHVISLIHPHDCDMVTRLLRASLQYASENDMSKGLGYFVTYRIKHKDGSYIKILRQSNVFDADENGKIISNVSMITDISFMDASEKVQWKFVAPGLDQKKFKKYITKEYVGFFSERQHEILKLLKEGATSSTISQKLFISKHTVDGHRRNMLHKSNCTNTIDLINFSKTNGLI